MRMVQFKDSDLALIFTRDVEFVVDIIRKFTVESDENIPIRNKRGLSAKVEKKHIDTEESFQL